MTFGKLLHDGREKAGKKISQLAAKLGYSVPYVSDVERGRRAPFEVPKIIEAAKYLGLDVDQLLRAAAEHKGSFNLNTEGYPDAGYNVLSSLARSKPSEEIFQQILEILNKDDEKEKH
jgi:transcriptional regulator with XRE-family HTH domain